MTILIAPQTNLASSTLINISTIRARLSLLFKQEATLRIIGGVLAAGEYVKLQYYDGSTWRDAIVADNGGIVLDSENSVVTIYGRMLNTRVVKSVTAAEIGVEVV